MQLDPDVLADNLRSRLDSMPDELASVCFTLNGVGLGLLATLQEVHTCLAKIVADEPRPSDSVLSFSYPWAALIPCMCWASIVPPVNIPKHASCWRLHNRLDLCSCD